MVFKYRQISTITEGDEESDDDDRKDEPELDKQMGDLGEDEADKLDEQIWGSDEEQDQDESKVCNIITNIIYLIFVLFCFNFRTACEIN